MSEPISRARAGAAEVRVLASPETWIEGTAVDQLKRTASLPGMRLAAGLPDLHPGKGSPIGAAFVTEGWIYPTLVGNDIGCGIGIWRTDLNAKKPKREAWADRLRGIDGPWDGDTRAWLADRGMAGSAHDTALGTIGGGNHFAELQAVESVEYAAGCEAIGVTADAVYLCVHSGSRGFGEAILSEHIRAHGGAGLASGTEEQAAYIARHGNAMRWAQANRELIAARMLGRLKCDGERLADLCHNFVERREYGGAECWLHRKGAAPSTAGPVVIPGSRGAFTYLVRPVNPTAASAYSLAHGAGRKWSRTECRGRLEKRYQVRDLERTDLGSHVVCEDRELLYEEAPQAYKNITTVIADLVNGGFAEVLAILRPLVTYKVRR